MALYVLQWSPPAALFSRSTLAPQWRAIAIESFVAFATAVSTASVRVEVHSFAIDLLTVFVIDVIRELVTEFLASGLNGALEALSF